jgi:glycosyltransferase involved in cell wall biosynthesis
MEQSQKILSIIIPAYNCSKTIVNTLNSIDFTNESKFEVLIIDDGSTEDIYPLIKPIIDAHPNTVKYFKKQNGN